MSIASEITRLQGAKNTLKTKLNAKNDAQHQIDDETLDEYGDFVDSIPTGGGGGAVEENDVNFYDYDGTLLHSYSKTDFLALSEMPENPTHTGLTAQGWNWDLSDAKTYVTDYGILDIGQNYITDDGKTRLYITLYEGRLEPTICYQSQLNNTIIIDWGDGTTETVTPTSQYNDNFVQHSYSSAGNYVITLQSNLTIMLSNGTITKNVQNENTVYKSCLQKVEMGSSTNLGVGAFNGCYSLKTITITNDASFHNNYALQNCYSLKAIVIPKKDNVGITGSAFFNYCYSLKLLIFSSKVKGFSNNYLDGNSSIEKLIFPSGLTEIGGYGSQVRLKKLIIPSSVTTVKDFSGMSSLEEITIPSSVTSSLKFSNLYNIKHINMSNSANLSQVTSCSSLISLIIPSTKTSIAAYSFQNNNGMKLYDFTNCTAIPSLANVNAFTGIPSDCKIVVPDSLYEDWIVASNWTTYASYIIKESDYNAS